jgi:Domain of unknown function (DUF1939)
VYYYPNTYVHRTVPFVNNHDTFRPTLTASGNYTGWNTGSELSPHIEPNEPRMVTAYAVIMAMDGNPQLFFEDVFDIGYNGNRYNHDPKSSTSLPMRDDLKNLVWCHQVLDFKSGAYQVPHASADYLVIARAGKAVIGITDNWSTWQNQTVYTGFPAGTVLKDYSGANGTATVTVDANGYAAINTPPVNPALNIAGRRGYSVWGPVGKDGQTYTPPRAITTTQEWEMSGDLGDSHASSLGQGGAIPASSTNFRVVGKIFVDNGKPVTYILYPQNATKSLFVGLYNSAGTQLASVSGLGTLTGNYTPNFTGWVTIKVRNMSTSNPSQKCWVNVTYTAPMVVTNANAATSNNTAAYWSGNQGTSDWNEPGNWEEGLMPDRNTDVVIPSHAFPQPAITGDVEVGHITIEGGARLTIEGSLQSASATVLGAASGPGSWQDAEAGSIVLTTNSWSEFTAYPNPFQSGFTLAASGLVTADTPLDVTLLAIDGKCVGLYHGDLLHVNEQLGQATSQLAAGVYIVRVSTGNDVHSIRLVKEEE